jgi:hypothetical protein
MTDADDFLTPILNAVNGHAQQSGRFGRVYGMEPKAAPGPALSWASWVDALGPPPVGSGLKTTSGLLVLNGRIYMSALTEPQDGIDPAMTSACADMIRRLSADLTLGGLVRNIVLLPGTYGAALSARAGFLSQDSTMMRVYTLTIPVIINDLWEQDSV